eukprot:COSAG06_NODE_29281_length_559_cov_1.050000_1_plen_93_part_00
MALSNKVIVNKNMWLVAHRAYTKLAAMMSAKLDAAGAAAPPVSRYFAEDPEQTTPPGGGYFAQVLQEICAEATKTGADGKSVDSFECVETKE